MKCRLASKLSLAIIPGGWLLVFSLLATSLVFCGLAVSQDLGSKGSIVAHPALAGLSDLVVTQPRQGFESKPSIPMQWNPTSEVRVTATHSESRCNGGSSSYHS